ncbi:MAG TPA: IS21 family transposase [Bryobacteraceae bacterium]
MEEINQLKREGLSILAISNLTGYDRKTIRKYLLAPETRPTYGPRPAPASKLAPFEPYLRERLQVGVWNARVLLRELRGRNYQGGYTLVTDWLRPQREAAHVIAVRRFETAAGKQAQVDWGHLGSLSEDGEERALWGFTMTLGYSRRMMGEAATDQKLGTLLRMHEAAFRELGGVPEEILYDRMRTIWTGTDERGEIIWNAVFLDFARYWGFRPRLCRPYRAQTKGKIESGVKYVRRNFLCGLLGREPADLTDLNAEMRRWMSEVANQRVHGTTHEQVLARWEEEQKTLQLINGAQPTRTGMTSNARWRAMPMSPGKGADIRCHGNMPAKRSGCARRAAMWRCVTVPTALPCMRRRRNAIRSSPKVNTIRASLWGARVPEKR